MKPKIKNISSFIILISGLIFTNIKSLALTSDNLQPIHIESIQQEINLETHSIIFIGKVIIKRGSINIRADKIIMTCSDDKNNKDFIKGYGNPLTFYQLQNDGNPLRGHSQKLKYDLSNNLVTLSGNAYLEQIGGNIKSDYINYFIKKQQIKAFSNTARKVVAIILPEYLKNENINKHN